MISEGFVLFSIIFICFYIWIQNENKKESPEENSEFPPGPSQTQLFKEKLAPWTPSTELVQKIQLWKENYGDVIGIQSENNNTVIISNYNLIKEAFNSSELDSRHFSRLDPYLQDYKSKLEISESDLEFSYNLERKFIIKALRDYGFGTKTIGSIIQEDMSQLICYFKKNTQLLIDPVPFIRSGIFSSVISILTSIHFSHADPHLSNLLNAFEIVLSGDENLTQGQLSSNYEHAKLIIEFLEKTIERHRESLMADYSRDFIDIYLHEIEDTTDKMSPFYKNKGEFNLLISLFNLIGESLKTYATLSWSLYYISTHAIIQKKIQDEIDKQIGHFRLPSIKDKLAMPFTEGVMLETIRKSSVTPLGIPIKTSSLLSFQNYKIPPNTLLLANIYDLHHNESIWKNASDFNPCRFLAPNGKEIEKKHEPVVWSSIGKRASPADILASDAFFLFITSICQRFRLEVDGEKVEDQKSYSYLPKFKIVLEDRLEFLDRNELGGRDEEYEAINNI